MIDQGLAALLAAFAALVASYASIRSARSIAQLSAKQNIVGQDLKDLSHYLYEVVARSVEATKAKSQESFNDRIASATHAAKQLSELRIRHRYSIPFIFDPIWYLKGVPLYIEHYRHDLQNPRLEIIRTCATDLRKEIDHALEDYFFHGKTPNYWARRRLSVKGKLLENAFLNGRPVQRTKHVSK